MKVVSIDPFTAVADDRRRRMLEQLRGGERCVSDIVLHLGIRQPEVSKHLHVLRAARLVQVRRQGRERFYGLNGAAMKAIHEWTGSFEQLWNHQLLAIKASAETKQATKKERKQS